MDFQVPTETRPMTGLMLATAAAAVLAVSTAWWVIALAPSRLAAASRSATPRPAKPAADLC